MRNWKNSISPQNARIHFGPHNSAARNVSRSEGIMGADAELE